MNKLQYVRLQDDLPHPKPPIPCDFTDELMFFHPEKVSLDRVTAGARQPFQHPRVHQGPVFGLNGP